MVTIEEVQRAQKFAWAENVDGLIHVPGIGFLYRNFDNEWVPVAPHQLDVLIVDVKWRHMNGCNCDLCIGR